MSSKLKKCRNFLKDNDLPSAVSTFLILLGKKGVPHFQDNYEENSSPRWIVKGTSHPTLCFPASKELLNLNLKGLSHAVLGNFV